ncbi:LuxR C-terminal-related transcriptional regulator [Pseudomonas faucium]|uniref:LuxR C-terminal-related transcriptional regulator n=1 Tax=Pseudomonas faucium TaxID=2740518 RepID=UPI001F1D275C|nr:LuxR C-terminal-related transcriptional regulator [Pseudomonas faucium]
MHRPTLKPNQLRPPAEPPKGVLRARLLDQLATSLGAGGVVLLQAPLGYGKSTLLGQFARRQAEPWAWLRLTRAENQPLTLLLHLHAALQLPAEQRDTQPADALWSLILADLEARQAPLTLLLDDLHLLTAAPAWHYLDTLLHHPPAALRLVAASEGPPSLPLAHLRRDGRLSVLGARELALDSEETQQLALAREAHLGSDALYQLRAGSEGWPSGVLFWLEAYREALLGTGQAPADLRPITRQAYAHARQFLEEECLQRLPMPLRAFLEHTAVAQVFDAGLARELAAKADVPAALRQLQRLDLIIEVPQGSHAEYRYHPALRNGLYQRLEQRDPQQLRQLHRQAADWLLGQRRYTEAIYQFGRARDLDAVLSIVDRHGFELLREGKVNTLVDVLDEVAGHTGNDSFTLAVTEASTVMVTNDMAQACQCLRQLYALQRRQAVPRHPERVQQTVMFLRSRLAYLGGNLGHALALAARALQAFPQHNAARSVLYFDRANCLAALGQLPQAHAEASRALRELQGFGLSGYTNLLHLLLAQIELAQGANDAAWERLQGMAEVPATGSSGRFYELFRHLGKGLALLQANRLTPARHALAQAEVLALGFPHSAALPWVFHHQACLHWALGETGQAKARWMEVRRLARQYRLFTLYRQAGAWLARLALRDNDQDYLPDWLDQWHWCRRQYGEQLLPEEWLAYAWVQRHLGQRDKARQIQQALQAQAQAQGNHRLLLDALLLAAALQQDQDDALLSLEQALQLACAQGLGQLLQYEGDASLEALRQLLLPAVRERLGLTAPAPSRQQLDALFRPLLASRENAEGALLVPLSRRELEVLQRMARGQNNGQIAEAMFISLSTVKTHINNLFRKLDVADRDSALCAARELQLLS